MELLNRIDHGLARVERVVAAGMLGIMGVVVFLSVVHRMTASGFAQIAPDVTVPSLALDAAQPFALALTLWVGMLGASLAAHERRHLALDVGSKVWPESLRPWVAAVGHVVTALFCLVVLWLGWGSLGGHFTLWMETDGGGGTLSGTSIPKWAAVTAIPWGMGTLAFRFLLEAARTVRGEVPSDADDTLHQLGITTEEAQP